MVVTDHEEGNQITKVAIPEELPILPIGDSIVYPSLIIPLASTDPNSIQLIDEAVAGDKIIGVFSECADAEQPHRNNLYDIGVAALIARMFKMPDGSIRAFLQGLSRIRLKQITQTEPFLKGKVEIIEEKFEKTNEIEALMRNLSNQFQKVVQLAPNLPNEVGIAANNIDDPSNLADLIAANINLNREEGQEILELLDIKDRITKVTEYINRELDILELGSKIQSEIKGEIDKSQREFYLREQLKAIQRELGEVDERTSEINELREKIEQASLPEEAQAEADRELDRLAKMHPSSAEYTVSRTYLDWLINLPWTKSTEDNLDIIRADQVLDEDHYDLDKVKERILEYLAVRRLKEDMKGPILCFVGPPGTGKTSMGQSIARALGRKFIRMSLGGIRDEAEIRGHRRTYVGALPGRIIQGIRRSESNNPIFMLDEIDKIGIDFRGDPSAALLEVLDPEQNFSFADNYLDVPFDLSKVIFITTANLADPIPPALKDRMEVIELPGYTEQEKLHIASKYIVPRQLEENGLDAEILTLSDKAILSVIRDYTREAGVRNLEREIGAICRKVAKKVAEDSSQSLTVTPDMLQDFLGAKKFRYEIAGEADGIGVATGLAWTQAGGEVLYVEASLIDGKGELIITGQIGDIMQESARAALSYARANLVSFKVKKNILENKDIHIHVPAGAIPKDGPSAGIAMATALISVLINKPVNKDVALTGEITLRGRVLPIGGLKEKALGALRAGIHT
jgi:ATP-dependent Lon protease